MTRTPPVYTVRWSSQVSRSNNRLGLGPPTPAPNAVSAASPAITLFFHRLFFKPHRYSDSDIVNNGMHDTVKLVKIKSAQFYSNYLIINNKFSILLIVLWVYRFIAIDL